MLNQFKTVLKEAAAEVVEKKSRFIAVAKPIETEEEARKFIEEKKKEHWNATHNVFAYQIGERNEIQRFSDDGEPQGTAGMPVLNVLVGEDIKNTVIVVTRYFGGTLLGTGGLVRAYGKAAKEAVIAAQIVKKVLYQLFSVLVDYPLSGKVQYEILQNEHIIKDIIYTDKVSYLVLCQAGSEEQFISSMTEASGGKAEIQEKGMLYGVWLNGQLQMKE